MINNHSELMNQKHLGMPDQVFILTLLFIHHKLFIRKVLLLFLPVLCMEMVLTRHMEKMMITTHNPTHISAPECQTEEEFKSFHDYFMCWRKTKTVYHKDYVNPLFIIYLMRFSLLPGLQILSCLVTYVLLLWGILPLYRSWTSSHVHNIFF